MFSTALRDINVKRMREWDSLPQKEKLQILHGRKRPSKLSKEAKRLKRAEYARNYYKNNREKCLDANRERRMKQKAQKELT